MKRPRPIAMEPPLKSIALGDERTIEIIDCAVEVIVRPELAPELWMLDAFVEAYEIRIIVNIGSAQSDGVEEKRQERAECRRAPMSPAAAVVG